MPCRENTWRRLVAVSLCSVGPVWLGLFLLEQPLLEARILNTRDLWPFIGAERGTVSDYLLNVWHWDGLLFVLMLAALPCFFLGLRWWKHSSGDERR
jgi:hypothetical protein